MFDEFWIIAAVVVASGVAGNLAGIWCGRRSPAPDPGGIDVNKLLETLLTAIGHASSRVKENTDAHNELCKAISVLSEELKLWHQRNADRPEPRISAVPPTKKNDDVITKYRQLVASVVNTPDFDISKNEINNFIEQVRAEEFSGSDAMAAVRAEANTNSPFWIFSDGLQYICVPGYYYFSKASSFTAGQGWSAEQILGPYFHVENTVKTRPYMEVVEPAIFMLERNEWRVERKGRIHLKERV